MFKILFLCTGNSCRSQMAEGLANHFTEKNIQAYSAGTDPHGINPNAAQVMAEIGIDINHQKSQHVSEFTQMKFDYVITLCGSAKDICPAFPGETQHHGFEDPPQLAEAYSDPEQKLDCYRKVRDQIKQFVLAMPDNLK